MVFPQQVHVVVICSNCFNDRSLSLQVNFFVSCPCSCACKFHTQIMSLIMSMSMNMITKYLWSYPGHAYMMSCFCHVRIRLHVRVHVVPISCPYPACMLSIYCPSAACLLMFSNSFTFLLILPSSDCRLKMPRC